MKILYLINTKQYGYHKNLIKDFTDITGGEVINMSDGIDLGSIYGQIAAVSSDVVITFDLAGHILRTGSDTLSLNNIYARMAHILFHKTDFYGQDIKARQNLSMFTYIPNSEDPEICRERLIGIPNISRFVGIDYKTSSAAQHEANRANIAIWWDQFKKDAML